ncbi:MAG: hypothetical protein WEC59_11110 [Salibacteraceae bacterium]
MKHLISYNVILAAIFIGLFSLSCKRELKRPGLENEVLTPILSTKLTINQIVPDSVRNESNDGHVSLIYRNNLLQTGLASFKELETRKFQETAKLQSLVISSRSAGRIVTLGQVLDETILSAVLTHGDTTQIPQTTGMNYGPIRVDGTEIFETVTFDSGYMDISIENNFPTAMSNINFEIRNDDSVQTLIGSDVFNNVPVGETRTVSLDLAGKTVVGNILGIITSFDVDGTQEPVYIDSNDQLIVTVTIRNSKANSATAVFPAQDVVSLKDTTGMINVQDLRLTKATAKTGIIRVTVVSTIQDSMNFTYFVPGGKKEGIPLRRTEVVPPNSPETEFEFNVDGYIFDLTGSPKINLYNAFYSELTGRIDSTGELVNLSLNDSIMVKVELIDFIPQYIEGYLGKTSVSFGPQQVSFELFKGVSGGMFDFEEVNVSIGVENGTGVPFSLDVNTFNAINTKTNNSLDLDMSSLTMPFSIDAASSLGSPSQQEWTLSKSNSNINEVLNVLPNKAEVAFNITSNPDENNGNLSQFAADTNTLSAFADIEIPLSMIAEDLVVKDTIQFDVRKIENPEGIMAGEFYIICDNQFPFQASLEMIFIDDFDNVLETIKPVELISAGSRETPRESVLEWPFLRSNLDRILASSRVVFSVSMSTRSQSDYQKIYSDQAIEFTLSSRFNYIYESE